MFDLTWFNFCTWVILILTIWLLAWRYNGGNDDKSYPLIYYSLLVLYVRMNEGQFQNEVVFAAICAAMLIRFEFLGAVLLRLTKFVEAASLAYVFLRATQLWIDATT